MLRHNEVEVEDLRRGVLKGFILQILIYPIAPEATLTIS